MECFPAQGGEGEQANLDDAKQNKNLHINPLLQPWPFARSRPLHEKDLNRHINTGMTPHKI